MKKPAILSLMTFAVLLTYANLPLNPSDVKWEQIYNFDKCNVFVMEFLCQKTVN